MKRGKKYQDSVKSFDKSKLYDPEEACTLVIDTAKANFDETVEISVRLGVDPRHADQQVRGAIVLPHGTGKSARVLVFAKGESEKEAKEAGAETIVLTDSADRERLYHSLDHATEVGHDIGFDTVRVEEHF